MITTIHEQKPVARKDYKCEACLFIRDGGYFDDMTFGEKRLVVKARQNKWMIKKGERYIRQFNTDGSDTWTFRAIPAMHDICVKYHFYHEI